jgi:hydrogenase maturation factor
MNKSLETGVRVPFISPSLENGVRVPFMSPSPPTCELDAEGHCITCSDEALTALVLSVDEVTGFASVAIGEKLDEVDIILLDEVAEGDLILVHGGVAIGNVGKNPVADEASNA